MHSTSVSVLVGRPEGCDLKPSARESRRRENMVGVNMILVWFIKSNSKMDYVNPVV